MKQKGIRKPATVAKETSRTRAAQKQLSRAANQATTKGNKRAPLSPSQFHSKTFGH